MNPKALRLLEMQHQCCIFMDPNRETYRLVEARHAAIMLREVGRMIVKESWRMMGRVDG